MERTALKCLKWGLLFACVDIRIDSANIEILPTFVGMMLFYASIQIHSHRTQAEERIKPLFLILAADHFLHWIWEFENGVEGLLRAVIYVYAIYVLTGETAVRVREYQPDQAGRLESVRVAMVLVHMFSFLVSSYGNVVLNFLTIFAAVGVWATFAVVLWGIRPEETME